MSHWMGAGGGSSAGLFIGVGIAVLVLLLRNSKPRPLKIERLWVRPAIFAVLVVLGLDSAPPPLTVVTIALMAAAAVVGAALGWQRGRFIHIDVDPETHALTTRVSPLGLVFIVVLLALRMGLRQGVGLAPRVDFPVVAAADALILMLGAMMVAQSLEVWLRARRVWAEARAALPQPIVR